MSYRAAALWELKDKARRTVACSVAQLPSGRYRIIVSSGSTVVLTERFDNAIDAIRRAGEVAQDLIDDGWTKIRLPRPHEES
jgi:hypothetical protein